MARNNAPLVRIGPVTADGLDAVLPLIASYQTFYEVEAIDEARNRAFFTRLLAPSDEGLLLAAHEDDEVVGFATLYWTISSLSAGDVALLNDVYVSSKRRGSGTGRALIEAAADAARERGLKTMSWATALDNRRAQRLYESLPAQRSAWFEYELDL